MPKPTLDVLNNKIDNLTFEMRAGFKSIESRQNKTNGNIEKNANRIALLEKEDIRQGNRFRNSKLLWTFIGIIISLLCLFLGKYII